MRNKVLFEDVVPKFHQCFIKGMSLYKEFQVTGKETTSKSLYAPSFTSFLTFGYFDGASLNGECGCGMILF